MMRRAVSIAAVTLLALANIGVLPARAATLEAAGWWWRLQTGLVTPVPPPPSVPEGGLYVAGAPDGPVAVSAVRFRLDDDETEPRLSLSVASDSGGEVAIILVCAVETAWIPTHGGAWDIQPESDCDDAVEGERSPDGGSWSFALDTFVRDSRIDVVLRPGVVADAPGAIGGSSFDLAFEPVTSSSLLVTTTQNEEEVVLEPPSYLPPSYEPPAGTAETSFGSAESFYTDGTADDLAAAVGPEVAAPEVPAPQPTFDGAPRRGAGAVEPELVAATPPGQVLGVGVVAALLLLVYMLSRQPTPAPRLLAGFRTGGRGSSDSGVTIGGVGRFARARTGSPPKL